MECELKCKYRRMTLDIDPALFQELAHERRRSRLAEFNVSAGQVPVAMLVVDADEQLATFDTDSAGDELDVLSHLCYPVPTATSTRRTKYK